MIFHTYNYSTRKELEQEIASQVGTDPAQNIDHTIAGTKEFLANLNLSTRTTVFGVRCVETEE